MIVWLVLLLWIVGSLAFIYVSNNTERDFSEDKELYEKGFEHGRRGYLRDPDHREAYNDGYSDGVKARIAPEVGLG